MQILGIDFVFLVGISPIRQIGQIGYKQLFEAKIWIIELFFVPLQAINI
jgi:hypothetical protein